MHVFGLIGSVRQVKLKSSITESEKATKSTSPIRDVRSEVSREFEVHYLTISTS